MTLLSRGLFNVSVLLRQGHSNLSNHKREGNIKRTSRYERRLMILRLSKILIIPDHHRHPKVRQTDLSVLRHLHPWRSRDPHSRSIFCSIYYLSLFIHLKSTVGIVYTLYDSTAKVVSQCELQKITGLIVIMTNLLLFSNVFVKIAGALNYILIYLKVKIINITQQMFRSRPSADK